MSELGKVPSFEPDDNVRRMIEEIFIDKQDAKKEQAAAEPKPVQRHRIRIPEPPVQSKEEQGMSIGLANQEIETLHEAFLEFSEKTSDLIIYGHLYAEILKLTEVFQDMEAIINDDFDKEGISEHGLGDYEKLRKIRARVLADVYKKYKKNE